jgi:hypothetical protein
MYLACEKRWTKKGQKMLDGFGSSKWFWPRIFAERQPTGTAQHSLISAVDCSRWVAISSPPPICSCKGGVGSINLDVRNTFAGSKNTEGCWKCFKIAYLVWLVSTLVAE